MSICSAHREPRPDCKLCQMTPADIFGKEAWDAAVAEAEAAGLVTCKGLHHHWNEQADGQYRQDEVPTTCGFRFYRTVDGCPLCGTKWGGQEPWALPPPRS